LFSVATNILTAPQNILL